MFVLGNRGVLYAKVRHSFGGQLADIDTNLGAADDITALCAYARSILGGKAVGKVEESCCRSRLPPLQLTVDRRTLYILALNQLSTTHTFLFLLQKRVEVDGR